ncbi:MAG: T9SS type A sorting domain-containing protein [Candidatus Kapaibacterium sp.]
MYSLPGKLPHCTTTLSGVTPSTAYADPYIPTSAYPNPSSGRVRIAYQLPPGVSSGEIILTTEDGTEVKRYHVTSAFSDLLIQESDLPSGTYFYKLVTAKGESPVQAISIMK